MTHSNGKNGGHSEKVIGIATHGENLGNDGHTTPLDTKDFSQFAQVDCGRFSDGENGISEPGHAKVTELIVEELDA